MHENERKFKFHKNKVRSHSVLTLFKSVIKTKLFCEIGKAIILFQTAFLEPET